LPRYRVHPFRALREQFEEYRSPGRCTLIGGGKTSADQAALFNSGRVRYVDLLDSYMSPGGLCHPSDNFRTVLAAAEQARASGEQFMLALAVAYEIQCRFTAVVPVMAKGFNHAIQLAISSAAGAGKLFGLTAGEIANAIAIATVDNLSLACLHAEPVSQWKGFSPGMTGMRAVYAASLAKRGFTGPNDLFEGPKGLEQMFGQSIVADWEDPSLAFIMQTVLTARFPQELCARITVRMKDQRILVKEHLGYEGGLDNPMSWDRIVEKFHWLSEAFADKDLRARLIQSLQQLDAAPISDLMGLLAQVRPTAVFPKTHPGIQ
jgi:2-methylcitrate dehydratase PrpD